MLKYICLGLVLIQVAASAPEGNKLESNLAKERQDGGEETDYNALNKVGTVLGGVSGGNLLTIVKGALNFIPDGIRQGVTKIVGTSIGVPQLSVELTDKGLLQNQKPQVKANVTNVAGNPASKSNAQSIDSATSGSKVSTTSEPEVEESVEEKEENDKEKEPEKVQEKVQIKDGEKVKSKDKKVEKVKEKDESKEEKSKEEKEEESKEDKKETEKEDEGEEIEKEDQGEVEAEVGESEDGGAEDNSELIEHGNTRRK